MKRLAFILTILLSLFTGKVSAQCVVIGPGMSAICQGGTSDPLGGSVGGTATGGTWSTTAGGTFSPSAGDLNASWTPPGSFTGTATLVLTSSGGSCSGESDSKTIVVNPLPIPTISGIANSCIGTTGVTYTTEASMSGYSWTVSGGGLITAGSLTRQITVTWNSAGSQTVSVNYINGNLCTASAATVYNVTVNSLPVPVISGPLSACAGSGGNLYSTQPGMSAYSWTVSSGGSVTAGTGTSAITVTWNTSGAKTVSVNYIDGNGCTAAVSTIYNVNVTDSPLPTISGSAELCSGSTGVSYATESGMSGYTWTISAGGIITSGGGTNTAEVTWSTPGTRTISVNYTNGSGCTAGIPTTYSVTVNPLPVPVVSGPASACITSAGNVYSTTGGMTNYLWVISPGGSISSGGGPGNNSVTVTWNSAGAQTVSVNYTNAQNCTASASTVYNVTVISKPLPTNVTITGLMNQGATLTAGYLYVPGACFAEILSQTRITWYRADDNTGTNSSWIVTKSGLDKTYILSLADQNKYIRVSVELSDGTLPVFAPVFSSVWIGPAGANSVPSAGTVTITGTLQVKSILTGHYNYSDPEGDPQGISTFQWYTRDTPTGSETPIAGATAISYKLTRDERNKYVGLKVIPLALTGTSPGPEATSNTWVGPVNNNAPSADNVTISGTPRVGSIVTGSYQYSDAEGDLEGTSTYQWYKGDNASGLNEVMIPGATSISFKLTNSEYGKFIGLKVSPVAVDGNSPGTEAVSSVWLGPVINNPPVAVVGLISGPGTFNVNDVITGNYEYSDEEGDAEDGSLFQWWRSPDLNIAHSVQISGAAGISYKLAVSDTGKYIFFRVTPVAKAGINVTGSQVTSSGAGKVNTPPYAVPLTISGTVAIGSTVTGNYVYHDGDKDIEGGSIFRWFRDGVLIPGANSKTYNIAEADEGYLLSFEVTPVSLTGYPDSGSPIPVTGTIKVPLSANLPVASQLCVEGIRSIGNSVKGKYVYSYSHGIDGSLFRWMRDNDTIPGAVTNQYTLTASDIGHDIYFVVIPRTGPPANKRGLPVKSNPLARVVLAAAKYSVADPLVTLIANQAGGIFSGPGVSAGIFSPEAAGTVGSPHTISYYLTIVNASNTCSQVASDKISVLPIITSFEGFNDFYCYDGGPDTIKVISVPATATSRKFRLTNPAGIVKLIDSTTLVIDPGLMNPGDRIDTLFFTYRDAGSIFPISRTLVIDNIGKVSISNLDPGDVFCNNEKPYELFTSHPGGVFSGNVTNSFLDLSAVTGNVNIGYTYTNVRTGCFGKTSVPIVINPAAVVSFLPIDYCIESQTDATRFKNLTTSADSVKGWVWNFYDPADPAGSELKEPGHLYKTGGFHKVSLTATTIKNCPTTKEITFDLGLKADADFYWERECFYPKDTLFLFDKTSSSAKVLSRSWNFFDGDSLRTVLNPQYIKKHPGILNVQYIVNTVYASCADTVNKVIYIRPTITLEKDNYFEDFESGQGDWVKEDTTGNVWSFGTPDRKVIKQAASGGVNAWFTRFDINNQKAGSSSVISPCFDFTKIERPMIQMKMWKLFDRDRDGAILQYKVGDEKDWSTVGTFNDGINWYNSTIIRGRPGGEQVGWTTRGTPDTTYVDASHTLNELKGMKDVKFRIAYGSDGNSSENDGIAIDDIWIGERSRHVLLEHFANTTSLLSSDATAMVNTIAKTKQEDVINIQYHTNFPGTDPFYDKNPADVSARILYYGLTKAPYSFIDGGTGKDFANIFDYRLISIDSNDVSRRSLVKPPFDIVLRTTVSGGVLTVSGSVKALEKIDSDNFTLYIAVTEKENKSYTGAKLEKVFYNVFRKFIPDASGINLKTSWKAGDTVSIAEKSWIIEKTLIASDIEVVAFIQNNSSKVVYQAASEIQRIYTVGIDNLMQGKGGYFSLYPNPATDRLTLAFKDPLNSDADIRIYDIRGIVVASYKAGSGSSEFTIENHGLRGGIYLVRISSAGIDFGFKKLIITGD